MAPGKPVALVFVGTECPIANRMAPEIERLYRKFQTNDILFCIVYPNASDTDASIRKHRDSYRLNAPYVRDTNHALVKWASVRVTPEAAVFDGQRNLVYRGRITDQFLALGKSRPEPTRRDLEAAIEAVLAGRAPKESFTRAVGCYIEKK